MGGGKRNLILLSLHPSRNPRFILPNLRHLCLKEHIFSRDGDGEVIVTLLCKVVHTSGIREELFQGKHCPCLVPRRENLLVIGECSIDEAREDCGPTDYHFDLLRTEGDRNRVILRFFFLLLFFLLRRFLAILLAAQTSENGHHFHQDLRGNNALYFSLEIENRDPVLREPVAICCNHSELAFRCLAVHT